jgi:hypothetical protein
MSASGGVFALLFQRAQRRIQDALDHYAIGYDSMRWGLPVDWQHVARRMAEALGEDDDAQRPPREGR